MGLFSTFFIFSIICGAIQYGASQNYENTAQKDDWCREQAQLMCRGLDDMCVDDFLRECSAMSGLPTDVEVSDAAKNLLQGLCLMGARTMCVDGDTGACIDEHVTRCRMTGLTCAHQADNNCMDATMDDRQRTECLNQTLVDCLPTILSPGQPRPPATGVERVMREMEKRTFDSACTMRAAINCLAEDMDPGCMRSVEGRCTEATNRLMYDFDMEMEGGDGDRVPGDGNTDEASTDTSREDGNNGGNPDTSDRTTPATNGGGNNNQGGQCTIPSSNWECNFGDGDFCGMAHDSSVANRWLTATNTPSSDTGPERGFDDEYFMFIETSDPVRDGDIARIELPISCGASVSTSSVCLRFMYHMRGYVEHMGKVSVVVKATNGGMRELWKMEGTQGDAWLDSGNIGLQLNSNDKVYIAGQKKEGHTGDAAVDKITLRIGSC